MAAPQTDDELISLAREKSGVNQVSAIPRPVLASELEDVKSEVATQVASAVQNGELNLYQDDAELQMAKYLMFLRTVEIARRKGAKSAHVPEKEIPRGFGRLRRHSFQNPTLGHWRDKAVHHYNRLVK